MHSDYSSVVRLNIGILLLAELLACLSSKPLDDATIHSLIGFFTDGLLDQNLDMDSLLIAFLELFDSSALSLDLSFEKLLESRASITDQKLLIDRAIKLGSVLLEAGKRSARKRSSVHNSVVWALPPDVTVKIFSLLDTQSLCYATATCSMFNKCAMDPLCYTNINLNMIYALGKSIVSLL